MVDSSTPKCAAMSQLWTAGVPDRAAVLRTQKAIDEIEKSLRPANIGLQLSIWKVLKRGQRAILIGRRTDLVSCASGSCYVATPPRAAAPLSILAPAADQCYARCTAAADCTADAACAGEGRLRRLLEAAQIDDEVVGGH